MREYATASVVLSALLALGSLWSAGTHVVCKRFPRAWSCDGEPPTPLPPPQSPATTASFSWVAGHVDHRECVPPHVGNAWAWNGMGGAGTATGDRLFDTGAADLPSRGGDLWIGGGVTAPRAPEREAPNRSVLLCLGDRCPIRIDRAGVFVEDRLTERGDLLLRWFAAWAQGFPDLSRTVLGGHPVENPTEWHFASGAPGTGGGLPGSIYLIAPDHREVLVIRPDGDGVRFIIDQDDHPLDRRVVAALYAWVGASVEVQGMPVRLPIQLGD